MKRVDFKADRLLHIAVLTLIVYLVVEHIIGFPDLLKEFLKGLFIGIYLIGIYSSSHDMSKLKDRKRQLKQKFFKLLKWT